MDDSFYTGNVVFTTLCSEISFQFGRLIEWFYKTFPEGRIVIEANLNKVNHFITYTVKVYTNKMVEHDMGYFSSTTQFHTSQFLEGSEVIEFKNNLFSNYKKTITVAINNFYNESKSPQ